MRWVIGGVVLLLLGLPGVAVAAPSPDWEFGLRGGLDAKLVEERFTAGEVYLLRALPWQADFAAGKVLGRIDLGVGLLDAAGDQGAWLAAGADLIWRSGGGLIALEAGFRPAWLSRSHYGADDLGGDLQFASHVGINFDLSQFVVSYRYQHLSNAGIYDCNGGLDLHLVGVGVHF